MFDILHLTVNFQ